MKPFLNTSWLSYKDLAVWGLLLSIGVLDFYLALTSKGLGFGGDSFGHYNIAKYSWDHPELFLHLWGKPFFTLVSSPFAQFGLLGIKVFNILCCLVNGFLLYRIGDKSGLNWAWTVIPLFAFVPVYIYNLPSGYTEPFFGLWLTLSAFFLIKDKLYIAAIITSFLPFIRSEGFLLLPVIGGVLLLLKAYKATPFLAFGFIIYSLVGFPFKEGLFWVLTENPYGYGGSIYGSGSFFHFFNATPKIFGVATLILACLGFLIGIYYLLRHFRTFVQSKSGVAFLIFAGSFAVYFMAHTIFWWKGLFNSLGLVRVMGAVAPFLGFLGLYGLNFCFKTAKRFKWGKVWARILALGMVVWAIIIPFELKEFPVDIKRKHKLAKKAALWLKQSDYFPPNKLFYKNPIIPIYLEMDPFDKSRIDKLYALDRNEPAKGIPDSSLIYWESRFGPKKTGITLQSIKASKNLKQVYHLKPDTPIHSESGEALQIYFFHKKSDDTTQ